MNTYLNGGIFDKNSMIGDYIALQLEKLQEGQIYHYSRILLFHFFRHLFHYMPFLLRKRPERPGVSVFLGFHLSTVFSSFRESLFLQHRHENPIDPAGYHLTGFPASSKPCSAPDQCLQRKVDILCKGLLLVSRYHSRAYSFPGIYTESISVLLRGRYVLSSLPSS